MVCGGVDGPSEDRRAGDGRNSIRNYVDAGGCSRGRRVAGFTRYVSQAALYAINPTTEEIAKQVANRLELRPVQRYDLKALPAMGTLPTESVWCEADGLTPDYDADDE